MDIRTGKYYKLFSMILNGNKYYFVGLIEGGFIWSYSDEEKAIMRFEYAEENYPI